MKKISLLFILLLSFSGFSQSLMASNDDNIISLKNDNVNSSSIFIVNKLFFDFNKYDLSLESIHSVKAVIAVMKENPTMKISINSYSEAKETFENLSLKRAIETKNFFIKKGISSKSLKIKNFGSSKQVSEKNIEGIDRRVEFVFEK